MDGATANHTDTPTIGVPVYVEIQGTMVRVYVMRKLMPDVAAGEKVELTLTAGGGIYKVEGRIDAVSKNVIRVALSRLYRQFFQSMLAKHPFALVGYRKLA